MSSCFLETEFSPPPFSHKTKLDRRGPVQWWLQEQAWWICSDTCSAAAGAAGRRTWLRGSRVCLPSPGLSSLRRVTGSSVTPGLFGNLVLFLLLFFMLPYQASAIRSRSQLKWCKPEVTGWGIYWFIDLFIYLFNTRGGFPESLGGSVPSSFSSLRSSLALFLSHLCEIRHWGFV